MDIENDLTSLTVDLLRDFLFFTRFFFEKKTGRKFIISRPVSSESHFIEIARELTNVFLGKTDRLIINCPPGWSKSELIKSFICWTMAHYPDCNNLYISYSHELAASHTYDIKQTISMPLFKNLFSVTIPRDSSAKDFFRTTAGGAVAAFGSSGSVTGRNAGLPGLNRYSGATFIDDIHKPDEVHSDVLRSKIRRNYFETIEMRSRGYNVPIIIFGQRLHEDDLFAHLMSGQDGREWKKVIIRGEDDAGNPRYPEVLPLEILKIKKKTQPYVYASQIQQDPIPAGGALYKPEDFVLLDNDPEILATFVTVDTAETEKEWNDKTVFSFWGIYKILFNKNDTGMYGLHWLNCVEQNLEPKDIEPEFLEFWTTCMRHTIKPQLAIIEKKSTGVTLISVLKNIPGIKVLPLDRTAASGSKSQRFIDMQQYIAGRQISLPNFARHTKMCVEHMVKITANNTHRFDDIADTCYDAVRAALIDKIIVHKIDHSNYDQIARNMLGHQNRIDRIRNQSFGNFKRI